MTDMHREAFEWWISEEGEYPERLQLDYMGAYASYSTYAQWQVWCAAIRYMTEQSTRKPCGCAYTCKFCLMANEQRDSHE